LFLTAEAVHVLICQPLCQPADGDAPNLAIVRPGQQPRLGRVPSPRMRSGPASGAKDKPVAVRVLDRPSPGIPIGVSRLDKFAACANQPSDQGLVYRFVEVDDQQVFRRRARRHRRLTDEFNMPTRSNPTNHQQVRLGAVLVSSPPQNIETEPIDPELFGHSKISARASKTNGTRSVKRHELTITLPERCFSRGFRSPHSNRQARLRPIRSLAVPLHRAGRIQRLSGLDLVFTSYVAQRRFDQVNIVVPDFDGAARLLRARVLRCPPSGKNGRRTTSGFQPSRRIEVTVPVGLVLGGRAVADVGVKAAVVLVVWLR
jgi:hypothetical protein